MERYTSYQHIIRISGDEPLIREAAQEIALVTAARLGTQGANIAFGLGLWNGDFEFGANIEICTRMQTTNEDAMLIRNHVTAMGLTAFMTVNTVEAHELY